MKKEYWYGPRKLKEEKLEEPEFSYHEDLDLEPVSLEELDDDEFRAEDEEELEDFWLEPEQPLRFE